MIYKVSNDFHKKFKIGDDIWAFQFERCGGKTGKMHNKVPMYGKLVGYSDKDMQIRNFVPYKLKNGKPTNELSTTKSTWGGKLLFADTYEEAVEHYNKLLLDEIEFHKSKIELLEGCIINNMQ